MAILIGNTNILELTGLASEIDAAAITDATVTVTLKTADGSEVTGAENLPMAHVAGSNGTYRAVLADDLDLQAGAAYEAHVTADAGEDRVGRWAYRAVAQVRR